MHYLHMVNSQLHTELKNEMLKLLIDEEILFGKKATTDDIRGFCEKLRKKIKCAHTPSTAKTH